jgi:putative transcriptional regulator
MDLIINGRHYKNCIAKPCIDCGEVAYRQHLVKRCEPCRQKKAESKFQRITNCVDCGSDLTGRSIHARLCFDCANNRKRGKYQKNRLLKNDNEIGREITKHAVKVGFLLHPSNYICMDCNRRQAECYDHRDYNKPLDVDAVCLQCNSKRGRGIPLFVEHSKYVAHMNKKIELVGEAFPNRIIFLREKVGLKRLQLSKNCGWRYGYDRLSNYERGIKKPSYEEMKQIVAALNEAGAECTLDDVFPPQESAA